MSEKPSISYGRGFAWNFIFNFITKVTFAIVGLVIANRLGPGPVGIYALLTTVYNLAELMREAGLKQAYNNDPNLTPERHRTYGRLSLFSGISFGVVLAALAYPLSWYYRLPDLSWCMLIAAAAVAINGFSAIPVACLLKAGRFRDTGLVESVATLAAALVAICFVFIGYGLLGLMLQLFTRSVVMFVLFQRLEPLRTKDYDKAAVKPIMQLCTHLVATDLLWMVYSVSDMLIIPKRLSTIDAGVYSWGKRLIWMPAEIVFSPLHRTVTVAVGNKAGDNAEVGRGYIRALTLAILLLMPIYIYLSVFAEPLVHTLLSPAFYPTAAVLPILCIFEATRAICAFGGTALVAAGKAKIPMYGWLLPYPVAGSMLAFWWNDLTIVKVAWASSAGMVAVCIYVSVRTFMLANSASPEKLRLAKSLGCVIATGLVALTANFLLHSIEANAILTVIVGATIVPLVHLVLVGVVFGGKPTAFMSKSGLYKLRSTF